MTATPPNQSSKETGALHVEIGTGESIDEATAGDILTLTLFDLGADAVGESHNGSALVLTAGFTSPVEAEAAKARLLEQHGPWVASATVEAVSNQEWIDAQRAGLQPTIIGDWHIRAPWHPEPADIDPRHDIVIDPGAAFGHGAHPTTRMTIELMLEHLTPSNAADITVVDLGTGTGVAAIIAGRLGARVRAVEIDPAALEVAWFNIERNSGFPFDDVHMLIDLLKGDAADAQVETSDLVLVNVTLDVHRQIAKQASNAREVIASGILHHQIERLQDLYFGHEPITLTTSGEWAAVNFSKTDHMGRKN